ncbi:LamG domain-containing protein [Flavobacterium salmonis]|uniref:LamG-like jellyroll fold domain-containing protein n=1 Tax=Flavobacterium salmonis TaxID=2654844 RepID=A0A6V6Z1L5_9FLAO|nr:LamG domain-containing protein [Flavobacterium salmonis]CAD0005667.1 hypothetical protein FLAT13_02889 [Flavobacterium salmonis]
MNVTLTPRWASSALQLSNNDYVDCGMPLVLSNLNSFTLEAWVNPANLIGFQSIVGNVDNAIGGQYQLFLSDGYVCAYVGIVPYLIQSPEPITVNEWHHLASTFDSDTSTLTLYVDGNAVAQSVFSGKLPKNGVNVLVGAVMQQSTPTWYLQGQLGRVMIWNSVRDTEAILNDSVQVNIYKATENEDLVFYVDFSVMPSVDSSGNNIPLSYKNDAQYSFNVPSVVLGNNGYVDCGSSPDYSIPDNLPYTIEGWFFPTSISNGTLISYGLNGSWEYKVSYSNNQITGQRNSDSLQIVSNDAVIPYSYYHFALTYDDTVKALSLYINGNLQCVDYFPSPVTSVPNGKVLVGAQYNNSGLPTSFFNGAIQNIRIWSVCLEQSEVFQWMRNDVVNDNRLISNYDFTVNPPIDSTDKAVLELIGSASQTLQQINVPVSEPYAQLGIPQSINAIYLNQDSEAPLPPPASTLFAKQPQLWSEDHKEESWSQFVEHMNITNDGSKKTKFREQFDSSYEKARKTIEDNPNLSKVFTRTDANGMTRIMHHGLRGDTLVYEGAIGAESDCMLWWIQFIFLLTVGFFQALGLLPTTGNIATRIYNLVRANATVMNALTSLTGKAITATSAIGLMGIIYRQGLMWTIIKFVLTSAGWYALFWILRKVIAIVTGLEAAAILAGFIVWASQLTILSLEYNTTCGLHAQQQPAMV